MDTKDIVSERNIDTLKKLVSLSFSNLEKISQLVSKIEQEQKKEEYKNLPGVEGTFDGLYMLGDDGKKYEVPGNYAAKSRLVYGDRLKMVEEVGKTMFKQVEKVERQKLEGVLSKKEGKWYVLTDSGSYRISDVAAEFNQVQLNEKADILVPTSNLSAPYGALDKVLRPVKESEWKEKAPKDVVKAITHGHADHNAESKPKAGFKKKPKEPEYNHNSVAQVLPVQPKQVPSVKQVAPRTQPAPASTPAPKPVETTTSILEDDDLR